MNSSRSAATPTSPHLQIYRGGLTADFEAGRIFAANAAHEFRTPLVGAIAQLKRLRRETTDAAAARAAEIEATLKRLPRHPEHSLQLARAEGGRLRVDAPLDLRTPLRIVVEDAQRSTSPGRIMLSLPDRPVMSDLDPDAMGILCRNLIDNALRHGTSDGPVEVTISSDGLLSVANDGPAVPPETLSRLTSRFERGDADPGGSGLGLAIVAALGERLGRKLTLHSPRPGHDQGFEATISLPLDGSPAAPMKS